MLEYLHLTLDVVGLHGGARRSRAATPAVRGMLATERPPTASSAELRAKERSDGTVVPVNIVATVSDSEPDPADAQP